MKNKFKLLLLVLVMALSFITNVSAEEKKAEVYLFYSNTCPHCKAEIKMLDELVKENSNIVVYKYEVSNPANSQLLEEKASELGIKVSGVPFTVIGDKYFIGYFDSYNKKDIIDAINKELEVNNDVGDDEPSVEEGNDDNKTINLPIIGEVETKKFSLPILAVIMGTLDGFNPCAMWILLFLISMLVGMEDKKRMWILGLTFIITSAVVYTLFMVAWLNITLFLGSIYWIRLMIACVALIGGLINIGSLMKKKDDGCNVVDDKKRKKIFTRIKKFTGEQKFILAIIGIMMLAISVNLVELLCSAGLPVVFTQILALNEVSKFGYFIYILIYIFFFMLDDIIVFVIAMFTLKLTGVSTKYTKVSHLIGGILMIIIGLLLIFNPGLLMFN